MFSCKFCKLFNPITGKSGGQQTLYYGGGAGRLPPFNKFCCSDGICIKKRKGVFLNMKFPKL